MYYIFFLLLVKNYCRFCSSYLLLFIIIFSVLLYFYLFIFVVGNHCGYQYETTFNFCLNVIYVILFCFFLFIFFNLFHFIFVITVFGEGLVHICRHINPNITYRQIATGSSVENGDFLETLTSLGKVSFNSNDLDFHHRNGKSYSFAC